MEIVTVNRDLKIKIGQIAGVAEVQNILTKRNKTTMKAEVSVVKIKNCKFFDRDLDTKVCLVRKMTNLNQFFCLIKISGIILIFLPAFYLST